MRGASLASGSSASRPSKLQPPLASWSRQAFSTTRKTTALPAPNWFFTVWSVLQEPVPRVVDHKEGGGVLGEIGLLQVRLQLMPQLGGRLWVADSLRVTPGHASERVADGLGVPDRVLQLAQVLVVVDPDAQPRHAQLAPLVNAVGQDCDETCSTPNLQY